MNSTWVGCLMGAALLAVPATAEGAASPHPQVSQVPCARSSNGTVINDGLGHPVLTDTWYELRDIDRGGDDFAPVYWGGLTGYDVGLQPPNAVWRIELHENGVPAGTEVTTDRHFNIRDDTGTHHWWEEEDGYFYTPSENPQYVDYTSNYDRSSNWWAAPDGSNRLTLCYKGNDPQGYLTVSRGDADHTFAAISRNDADQLQLVRA